MYIIDSTILVITCILYFQQPNVSLTILGQFFKEKKLFLVVKENELTNQWTVGIKVYN